MRRSSAPLYARLPLQAPAVSRLPRLASPGRQTSIPTFSATMAPLAPSVRLNKRSIPSSPIVPAKRPVLNPLSVSSAGPRQSQRKPSSGFVPTTTRKPSSTLNVPRPASSLASNSKRTASTGSLGSVSSNSTASATRLRPAGIAATRRPPVTSAGPSNRAGGGLARSVGPGRGLSPGLTAGSGMVGALQDKVCMIDPSQGVRLSDRS